MNLASVESVLSISASSSLLLDAPSRTLFLEHETRDQDR